MRALLLATTDPTAPAPVIQIAVPTGNRVRIAAAVAVLSGAGATDQVQLAIQQQGLTPIAGAVHPGQLNGAAVVMFSLGANLTVSYADAVAGTYIPQDIATVALPDVWWPFAIEVALSVIGGGTVTLRSLVYEQESPYPAHVDQSVERGGSMRGGRGSKNR